MTLLLLLVHALVAVALLGAMTHQCVAAWRIPVDYAQPGFLRRFSSVTAGAYATPISALYLANFSIGCILYPDYRLDVRPLLEGANHVLALAAFETKEHLAVYGLGLLPGYWVLWNTQQTAYNRTSCRIVTALLAFFVWWSFVVGLLVNNIAGLSA